MYMGVFLLGWETELQVPGCACSASCGVKRPASSLCNPAHEAAFGWPCLDCIQKVCFRDGVELTILDYCWMGIHSAPLNKARIRLTKDFDYKANWNLQIHCRGHGFFGIKSRPSWPVRMTLKRPLYVICVFLLVQAVMIFLPSSMDSNAEQWRTRWQTLLKKN